MNAMQRMTKARTMLMLDQPFFGTLAYYLKLVEAPQKVEALATDGVSHFFNPTWVDARTDLELLFGWAHEVDHIAKRHHTRRGHRDPAKWNIATDYNINGDLIKAGFVAPPGILHDPKYDGLSAEQIYRMREDEEAAQQKAQQEQGDASDGDDQDEEGGADPNEGEDGDADEAGNDDADGDTDNAAGDPSDDAGSEDAVGEGSGKPIPSYGNCGAILDAAESPAEIAEQEAEWEARVRQAVNVAIKSAGHVPGYLERIVEELNASRVDWRDVLRRFIDARSRTTPTWSRPNKRMIHTGLVLPSNVIDGINHLGVVVDTSGSISDTSLTAFAAELQAAVDEGACDRVTVVYCDARVQGVETFEQGDAIKLTPLGGGGTDFRPALAWFVENEPDVSALVYFTDLYGTFGDEPDVPVLWAAIGDHRYQPPAPFGELVQIEV